MDSKYFIFLLLALIAEIIGTVSGFGSSILFVPLASLYFDFKTVLGITALFHVFSNLAKISLFRKGVDWNIALKLGIPAVVSVMIGAYMTSIIKTDVLTISMNIMLVLLAIYLLINFNKRLQATDKNLYSGGVISGLLAGLLGSGGAIRGLVLAGFQLSKDSFIATSSIIDLGVDFSRAVVYLSNGYMKKEFLFLVPFLILISYIGSYIGKLILQKTSEKNFRIIVLVVICVTAALQLINAL